MAKISHLMGAGLSPAEASRTVGGLFEKGGLTAAGNSKATSTLLTEVSSYISICSSSGKGVELIALDQGDASYVYNGGANTLYVYSNGTDTITNKSANGFFSIGTLKGCEFRKVTSSLIMVNLSS